MHKRKIGKSSVDVSPIMLGGNVFGWTADETTSFHVLDAFVDHGFNFIDTADVYSVFIPGHNGGESETILGKWFARSGKREKVVLATKVGMEMSKGKKGLKASYIHSSIDESLQRLQTDYVDLYQSHVDDESTPFEETLTAYDKLIKAGKVRMIGASNYIGARLTEALEASRALGVAEYVTLQPSFNLHTRENYETDLAPVVAKYGLSVIPYRALASGFLTGKYKSVFDIKGSQREVLLSREGYFDARGEKILTALADMAAEANASQAAVALAWLLTQPSIVSPIASARTPEQLNSLFEAAELELTPAALKQLTEASAY